MAIEMTKRKGAKLARVLEWGRVCDTVWRYIDEGNDFFTVDIGGFTVTFDGTKEGANDGNE